MSVSSDLDKAFEKKVTKATEQALRKTTLDLVGNLTAQTPVDTGTARRNWITTISQPSEQIKEGGSGSLASAQSETTQEAASALSTYNPLLDGPIWISNNLPYIGRLNDGSSQQAPAGFVDSEVSKAKRQIKQVFRQEQPR